jgi:hypothetical protein
MMYNPQVLFMMLQNRPIKNPYISVRVVLI